MTDVHTQRLGTGPTTAVAIHGITSSSAAWPAVAAALPDDWSLLAVDLRGRGHSRDLPGPWGLARHAEDVCEVAEESGARVLVGHSMGAYVAVLAAAARPDLFDRLVLVDGGIPLPVPEGADPDVVLAATLGPALERLSVVYADAEAYVDFFKQHPALADHWSPAVEEYVRYDVLPVAGGVRSRALEEAVRQDGRDLLLSADEIDRALRSVAVPVTLLVAPAGMFGQPPGLLPEAAVAAYADQLPSLSVETVPGTNHYTILFQPQAAQRIAHALTR